MGLEPTPSVWKTDVLTSNTNAAYGARGRNRTPHHPVLSQTLLYGRRHRQSSSTHSDRWFISLN